MLQLMIVVPQWQVAIFFAPLGMFLDSLAFGAYSSANHLCS